nr:trehalose-6-phosphate synthase [Motilibacter aurantiacus]
MVVVANRLPVEWDSASGSWLRSPGGLVSAMEPVVRAADAAWVGWSGGASAAGAASQPVAGDGLTLVPVPLSADEIEQFYEGFSNGTLWPLYHDVIAPPRFQRSWWESYVAVNERFAAAAARAAGPSATVWVHDYQLQLVPALLRERRPDLRIGFFNHIPFPGYELFAQLPWRRELVLGLLGADLVGFQRQGDATNFLRACRRAAGLATRGSLVEVPGQDGDAPGRRARVAAYPISIDTAAFSALARDGGVAERARRVRSDLSDPPVVLLGVDRLDYTKGIVHRLLAYEELLDERRIDPRDCVLVQVASPSRDRVDQYRKLRDDVEAIVGRINGNHGSLERPAVHYLHRAYPREEMAALYLVGDVMLVTSLRDGMNLVAKEYVACRNDETGALVLSEFTGAADELGSAFLVNPHDVEGLKEAVLRAVDVSPREARRRMRSMRKRVRVFDVAAWAAAFLAALESTPAGTTPSPRGGGTEQASTASREGNGR